MKGFALFIVLFLFINLTSFSQFLLLRNKRNFNTVRYYKGNTITYKLKDYPDDWKTASIDSVFNDFFLIKWDIVPINKILAIKIPRTSFNFSGDGIILMYGGAFFASISVINDIINKDSPSFTRAQLIIFPTMIITGLIFRKIPDKVCKVGKKYSLEIVQPRVEKKLDLRQRLKQKFDFK